MEFNRKVVYMIGTRNSRLKLMKTILNVSISVLLIGIWFWYMLLVANSPVVYDETFQKILRQMIIGFVLVFIVLFLNTYQTVKNNERGSYSLILVGGFFSIVWIMMYREASFALMTDAMAMIYKKWVMIAAIIISLLVLFIQIGVFIVHYYRKQAKFKAKEKFRKKLYVKAFPQENKVVFSGIQFAEFMKYVEKPIDNLLLIEDNYFGEKYAFNFALVEDEKLLEDLTKEDVYNYGEFCFVDYATPQRIHDLKDEEIAELLYMGHMFKAFHSPFIESLGNDFCYLGRDDGWSCTLYCKNMYDFMHVLCNKIIVNDISRENTYKSSKDLQEKLLELATKGLLIDLNEVFHKEEGLEVKLYVVGSISYMDDVLNNWEELKDTAIDVYLFHHENGETSVDGGHMKRRTQM